MESPYQVDVGELGVEGLRPLLRALTEACAQQDTDFFIIGALAFEMHQLARQSHVKQIPAEDDRDAHPKLRLRRLKRGASAFSSP